jgi:hypothetical protein
VIVKGGLVTYAGVGSFLLGPRFQGGLETFWQDPAAFLAGGAEVVAPFVLLLIPAVLGAIWTRETLRLVLRGIHKGDSPATIAKEVVGFILSVVVLIVVALFSSGRKSGY